MWFFLDISHNLESTEFFWIPLFQFVFPPSVLSSSPYLYWYRLIYHSSLNIVSSWCSNPLFAIVSKFGHFRSLHDASVHSAVHKWVTGYIDEYHRQWWKCEWLFVARNCCMDRMIPREAELLSEWTGLPQTGEVKCIAFLSGPTDWI